MYFTPALSSIACPMLPGWAKNVAQLVSDQQLGRVHVLQGPQLGLSTSHLWDQRQIIMLFLAWNFFKKKIQQDVDKKPEKRILVF